MGELITGAQGALSGIEALDTPTFDRVTQRLGSLGQMLETLRGQAQAAREALLEAATTGAEPGVTVTVRQAGPGDPRPAERPIDWLPGDSRRSRSGGGSRQDDYQRAIAAIREQTEALHLEAAALIAAAVAGEDYGDAIEYARRRAELMQAAQRDGREITPQLQAEIDALARSYIDAGNAAQDAADKMREAQERAERGAEAMSDLFLGIVQGGDAARRALAQLLQQLAQVQMQRAMLGLSGGGGVLGRAFQLLGGALTVPKADYFAGDTLRSDLLTPTPTGAMLDIRRSQAALDRMADMARRPIAAPQDAGSGFGPSGRAELVIHAPEGMTAEMRGEVEGVAIRVVTKGLEEYDRKVSPQTQRRNARDFRRTSF